MTLVYGEGAGRSQSPQLSGPSQHATSTRIAVNPISDIESHVAWCICSWTGYPRMDPLVAERDGIEHEQKKAMEEVVHRCRIVAQISTGTDDPTTFAAVCDVPGCGFVWAAKDPASARMWGDAHADLNAPRSQAVRELSDVSFGHGPDEAGA